MDFGAGEIVEFGEGEERGGVGGVVEGLGGGCAHGEGRWCGVVVDREDRVDYFEDDEVI